MQVVDPQLVSEIRTTSRDLVRQFGLMNQHVAGTDLSLSGVHAVIEVGRQDGISAKDLGAKLLLEKSTVSRLVQSLVARGELGERRSQNDLRKKSLHLTSKGRKTLRSIDRFAESQVSRALTHLDEPGRRGVLKGLQDYTAALSSTVRVPRRRFDIRTGYTPTLIGQVIALLLPHMHAHCGFESAFESRIARDLAEFMPRVDARHSETWRAEINGRIAGTISIDGEDLGDNTAHLRWFAVSEDARGLGAGRSLLEHALEFCDRKGFRETRLWTVKGLDAARHLYETSGFQLTDEFRGDQWGSEVLEQVFVRPLNPVQAATGHKDPTD